MPPYGLYPIPRNRLYGGAPKLPTFSTAPYLEEYNEKERERNNPIITDAVSAVSRVASHKIINDTLKLKKKRGRPTNADIAEREATAAREAASMQPNDVVATAVRRHSDGNSPHMSLKATQNKEKKEARRRKKEESRKRRRAGTSSPKDNYEGADSSSHSLGVKNNWLKALEYSMNGIGERFIESASEPPKKITTQRKIEAVDTLEHTCKTPQAVAMQKMKKSIKPVTGHVTALTNFLPKTNATPSAFSATNSTPRTENKEARKPAFIANDILVPETPEYVSRKPSQDSQSMISPSPLGTWTVTLDAKPQRTTQRATQNLAFSLTKTLEPKVTPVPAPAHSQTQQGPSNVGGAQTLTRFRSNHYPSTSAGKSRARSFQSSHRPTSDVTSAGASVSSASSTKSLPDYFTRIPKSSIPNAPQKSSPMKHKETHEEAPLTVFNNMFQEIRKTVNFTREAEEFSRYLEWHHRNDNDDPLPCLGFGSGCTEKKEAILRLGKEENVDVLKALESGGHDSEIPRVAEQGGQAAKELLVLAIRSRLPVPLGRIDGTWTLYCPKYARHHFDRYGYGERTLNIATIAGFRDNNNFTARLNIPPRPMTYSILTFAAPPHASFRTVAIKTAMEGYKMEVIFLGNGYLQLRVDLNLLLKGKASDNLEGQNLMEFVGVHESAVDWL